MASLPEQYEPMTTIYGIKNCDTMKRAFAWLKDHHVDYEFHDYKKAGVTEAMLESWSAKAGWEKLLNTVTMKPVRTFCA